MKDLLEKFVKLAPEEWLARLDDDGVELSGVQMESTCPEDPNWIIGFGLENDRHSAEAIIFLWDYLEEQCGGTMLWHEECRWGVSHHADDAYWGDTRIEALVRACVALWESQPAQAEREEE